MLTPVRHLPLLLLLGCPLPDDPEVSDKTTGETETDTDTDADADTDADVEADTDTDVDTDTDTDCYDTGFGYSYRIGSFEAEDGEFVAASFGVGAYGVEAHDWICRVTGAYDYEGRAPAGCPDCAWSWDLSPLRDVVEEGDCDPVWWLNTDLEGSGDASWGFAESYTYLYGDTAFELEDVLFLHYGSGWMLFAFTFPSYGIYQTYGDASYVELVQPQGYDYYYYDSPC